jgi:heme/copper-type cytochrome/quinol oxidase subunit 3
VAQTWPQAGAAPDLLWGTLNLAIILASEIPNFFADHAAIDHDLHKVRVMLIWGSLFGIVLCAVRALEFTALNVRWDESAYGSVVWFLLGLHTFNLVTDVVDTCVITVVMFKQPMEGKRFVDVAENSGYWDFIVWTWIPIYAVVYWAPRF